MSTTQEHAPVPDAEWASAIARERLATHHAPAARTDPPEQEIPSTLEDLRALPADALPGLARTVRRRLVEITSHSGGHLGPNLGVVELTIALHRAVDSPREAIVFDTGHQAYVHKMLTGRADLTGLRTAGGTSGYPDRAESAHDVVENSHASGSLAWAHGIDRARRAAGEDGVSVAVIGDGALTGGVALEALHDLATDRGSRALIVLNDNTRSYAPTIGGLAAHLEQLREGHIAAGDDLFSTLGLGYVGPVDGHDHVALAAALATARERAEDPGSSAVVLHVVTRKGEGFARAEADTLDHWHATGPFELAQAAEPEVVQPAPVAARTWTALAGAALLEAARADPRVIALSAAMIDPVGLTPLQQALPERVLDVGIAEQAAVATAAGLSRGGARPVVSLYATFLNRALDQLLLDVALHGEDVTVTLDRAGVTGEDGPSHHGIWDLALACQIPGASLWAPRDGERLSAALPQALGTPGTSIVRYPKGRCPDALEAIAQIPAGDVLAGDPAAPVDVLVVSIGALAGAACEAAAQVAQEHPEYSVLVLDPVQALPLSPALVELASSARAVVTLEDGVAQRGIGAALAVRLAQEGTLHAPAPAVRTLGIAQEFIPHGKREAILADHGLDSAGIARAIGALLG